MVWGTVEEEGRRGEGREAELAHIDGWACIMRMELEGSARVTVTNDPIANLGKGLSDLDLPVYWFVCLSLSVNVYVFVCLPGRRMCVAFITESHFNHRIFDLLPFDISLQWRQQRGGDKRGTTALTSQWSMWHVDTFAKRASDCECFWHVAIEI